jgi:FMN phosphatase YigB (HAD superfamily)
MLKAAAAWRHPFNSRKRHAYRRNRLRVNDRPLTARKRLQAMVLQSKVFALDLLLFMPWLSAKARNRFGRSRAKRVYELRRLMTNESVAYGPGGAVSGRQVSLRRPLYTGKAQSICVVVHAYYADVAEQIFQCLHNIPVSFDLFVTAPRAKLRQVEKLARRYFPNYLVRVVASENRGRNFAPFLVGLREEIAKYDLMLHLHTKKSLRTGIEQAGWRSDIVEHLIGCPDIANGVLMAFAEEPTLGLVGPTTFAHIPYWAHHWLSNAHLAEAGLARMGVFSFARKGFLDYPVGGMFWARPKALKPLLEHEWSYDEFAVEPAPDDGTMAHFVERALAVINEHSGYIYGETDIRGGFIRLGCAEKGLGRYFATIERDIDMLADRRKVVSLDFYDTLFTRLSVTPEDVQSYIGHILYCEGRVAVDTDFLKLRKAAEAAARKMKQEGDAGIQEIYRAFPRVCDWPKETIQRALDLELEVESRVLIPRAAMIEVCRRLGAAGCRLIVVSDTYMDESFIRKVLIQHGIDDCIDAIYCSSDVGCRKDNGTMWAKLAATEAASHSDFVHIGDNEHSDIQLAVDARLKAIGIINTAVLADLRGYPMPTGWRAARSDWRAGIALGPAIAKIGNNPFAPNPLVPAKIETSYDFGYVILGPLVFGFLSWLIRNAREHEIDKLMFLARGAYFLHRTYSALAKAADGFAMPEASYLFVSRRATLPAALGANLDPSFVVNGLGGFHGTFGELLSSRLGLDTDRGFEAAAAGIQVKLPRDREKVIGLINEHLGQVEKHCIEAADLLRTYLSQEGFFSSERVGLVDLGYSATIQKALQMATGKGVNGYYFGTAPSARDVAKGGGEAFACFGEEKLGEPAPAIIKYSLLLEAFFAAPTTQVDGYRRDGERVSPIYRDEPESGMHFKALQETADGFHAYCLDLVKVYGPEVLLIEVPAAEVEKPLRSLINGWGCIPSELKPALVVDDAFCGNGNLDVLSIVATNLK